MTGVTFIWGHTNRLNLSSILLIRRANDFALPAVHAGAGNLWLFIRLAPETFERVRANYGVTHHIGRDMSREIPKSWTYISQAWNKFARTPVTSAIENAKGGDEAKSVTFNLYGDGKGAKKNKKASVHLRLPKSLDNDISPKPTTWCNPNPKPCRLPGVTLTLHEADYLV